MENLKKYYYRLAVLSCSLFLNRYRKVRDNMLLSGVTWFLFPIVFPGFLIITDVMIVEFLLPALGILIITAPYLAGLARSYYLFTKEENRSGD